MTIALLTVIGILLIGLVIMIVLVLRKKDTLNMALGALIASLCSVVAAMGAPSFETSGKWVVQLGRLSTEGVWDKFNTTRPDAFWYVALGTMGFLTLVNMCLVYAKAARERDQQP